MTPELHVNKQAPTAELRLCLAELEALLGIQLPTQLLSATEQQDLRAPQVLLPSSPTSDSRGWPVKAMLSSAE